MKPRHFALVLAAFLTGCVTNASGPSFDAMSPPPLADGMSRIYVYREHAAYIAQASTIVSAHVTIDGLPVADLENGGFAWLDLPAGRHVISAQSGLDRTARRFYSAPGANGYIEVWDKTRMEGARFAAVVAAGAAGGAAAGLVNGVSAGQYALAGALNSAANDLTPDDTDGRIWAIEFPTAADAVWKLHGMAYSGR